MPCFIAELLSCLSQEFIDLEMDAYRNNVIRVSPAPYGEPCKIAVEDWNRLQQGGTSDR